MNYSEYSFGAHCYFAPANGTTSSRTAMPAANDASWIDLGEIQDINVDGSAQEIKIYGPARGKKRLKKVLKVGHDRTIKIDGATVGPLHLQVLFDTLPLTTSSTQANPGEGASVEGWIKFQLYNAETDAQVLIGALYTDATISGGGSFKLGDLASIKLEFRELYSELNNLAIS